MIANCTLDDIPGLDIRIRNGLIHEIGHRLDRGNDHVLDADGNNVIPGLCDHHIHLHALAARRASVECGPPHVHNPVELGAALNASSGTDGWVRGVGYFESVSGDLDRDSLDALHFVRPVRIQHRSGALWILNSAGVDAARVESADHPGVERDWRGRATGRVWRADAWLRDRIPGTAPPSLASVGAELAALGITTVTDATPDLDTTGVASIAHAMSTGELPQRVHLLGAPLGSEDHCDRLTVGPYKIVLADSGLPDLDLLARTITACHSVGRPIAAHSVSRESLLILLSVLDQVGSLPGDRIEHGALIPVESIPEISRLGLSVVTQPGFIADRGDDYLDHVDPQDVGDLYRCRSLLDSSVPVAFSSDAPYGPLDPWHVIRAAQNRTTPSGTVLGGAESIDFQDGLAAYLASPDAPGGPARRIHVGAPADIVVVRAQQPLATVIDGKQVH